MWALEQKTNRQTKKPVLILSTDIDAHVCPQTGAKNINSVRWDTSKTGGEAGKIKQDLS